MVAGLYKPSCAAIDMKQGLQLSAINNFSYLCVCGGIFLAVSGLRCMQLPPLGLLEMPLLPLGLHEGLLLSQN